MIETGLAFKLLWVLVLFPGYPDAYNPIEEAAYTYGAFKTEEECTDAKDAMERGYFTADYKGKFACRLENALVTK